MQWQRIRELALAITAMAGMAAGAMLWNQWQVDRDFHKMWMMLNRARASARHAGPVTVRFTRYRAITEDCHGAVLESLILTTLDEVRFRTTRGEHRVIFSAGGGQTSPYNVYLHGGDFTFRAWTGYSRSIWVHCSGGQTEGRNNDWILNSATNTLKAIFPITGL